MSKGRLLELKTELEDEGLEVRPAVEASGLLDAQGEVVRWIISNKHAKKSLELQFHLFDDLGRRTAKLTDILYVVTGDQRLKLYFEKPGSPEWREGLTGILERIKVTLDCE